MDNKNQYAVIRDSEYYGGDCQHPQGWAVSIASIDTEREQTICISDNIDECREWADELNTDICLSNGEAGRSYRVVELLDDNACYQTWLDNVDWDGCPGDDDDYDDNSAWAEARAYNNNGNLVVGCSINGNLYLVDLADLDI